MSYYGQQVNNLFAELLVKRTFRGVMFGVIRILSDSVLNPREEEMLELAINMSLE